jgi:hypothetical protein
VADLRSAPERAGIELVVERLEDGMSRRTSPMSCAWATFSNSAARSAAILSGPQAPTARCSCSPGAQAWCRSCPCSAITAPPETRDLSTSSQPRVKGSRVCPDSSTQMALVSVYSRMASAPFSRPMPLAPKPPKGTCGPTTR